MTTPGELAIGQYITVASTKDVLHFVSTAEGPKSMSMPSRPHFLTAVPVKIEAVSLPYLIVSYLVRIPQIGRACLIDTRLVTICEVKEEYVKAYKKFFRQKVEKTVAAPTAAEGSNNAPSDLLELFGAMHDGPFAEEEDEDEEELDEEGSDSPIIPPGGYGNN